MADFLLTGFWSIYKTFFKITVSHRFLGELLNCNTLIKNVFVNLFFDSIVEYLATHMAATVIDMPNA